MLDLANKKVEISNQKNIREIVSLANEVYQKITTALHTRISGMQEVVEQLLLAIFSGNHALLVGVPGLAKTLLVRSISEMISLDFSRIQFTPDLMPSDITGTEVLMFEETNHDRKFTFLRGPIFANIILADEINRTPPKTQAALLEAMEEGTVTALGKQFHIPTPFFVLATQNPIEQSGTYPLPISQLDRFMFEIRVNYPSFQEEVKIMRKSLTMDIPPLPCLLQKEELHQIIANIYKIAIPSLVEEYALRLVRTTRPIIEGNTEIELRRLDYIQDYVAWGVSPRAAQNLLTAAQTRAMLQGNIEVSVEDVQAVIHPVFRHRILLRASEKEIQPDAVIDYILENVPIQ